MIKDSGHSSRFQLWPYGWLVSTTETSILPEKGGLSQFTHQLVSHPVFHQLFSSRELINLQGASASSLQERNRPPHLPPSEGELIIISGRISPDTDQELPFWYQRRSEFKTFIQSHSLQFSVNTFRSETLPEWIPFHALPSIFPMSIDYVGVTLEFFKSSFISSMIGFAPSAFGSLMLDAHPSTLSLHREEEGLHAKTDLPLECSPIARELLRLCRSFQ